MSGFVAWYPKGGAQGPGSNGTSTEPRHPWDRIALGGKVIPCHHARMVGGGLGLCVDRKKTLGGDGSHPTYHGIDPQPLVMAVFFSTVEQLRDFAEMFAGIGPNVKAEPTPIPIDAQQIQHLGNLTAVVVRDVGAVDEAGPYKRVLVKLDHWLSPPGKKSKTSTPKRAKVSAPTNLITTPNPKPSAQSGFCGGGFTPGP